MIGKEKEATFRLFVCITFSLRVRKKSVVAFPV